MLKFLGVKIKKNWSYPVGRSFRSYYECATNFNHFRARPVTSLSRPASVRDEKPRTSYGCTTSYILRTNFNRDYAT